MVTHDEKVESRKNLVVGLTGLGLALLWLAIVVTVSYKLVDVLAGGGGGH